MTTTTRQAAFVWVWPQNAAKVEMQHLEEFAGRRGRRECRRNGLPLDIYRKTSQFNGSTHDFAFIADCLWRWCRKSEGRKATCAGRNSNVRYHPNSVHNMNALSSIISIVLTTCTTWLTRLCYFKRVRVFGAVCIWSYSMTKLVSSRAFNVICSLHSVRT